MSSILKALKKVEDDKAARRPTELNIDAEILRSDNPSRFSSASIFLAALLLLAGGSGITYIYMKQDNNQEFQNINATSKQTQLPPSIITDIKTEQPPAAIEVVPAKPENTTKLEKAQQRTPLKPAITIPKQDSPQVHMVPKPVVLAPAIQSPTALPASAKAVPVLRVNGIAFQEGGAGSVAMINGVPASSGSVIDGVRIEEVYKNRVKFSYNGDKFEILLGQSNQ